MTEEDQVACVLGAIYFFCLFVIVVLRIHSLFQKPKRTTGDIWNDIDKATVDLQKLVFFRSQLVYPQDKRFITETEMEMAGVKQRIYLLHDEIRRGGLTPA